MRKCWSAPWILGGAAGVTATAGAVWLLTLVGNIVEDKVQKATAPLAVKLDGFDNRMSLRLDQIDDRFKVVEDAVNRADRRLNTIQKRLTSVETRLDGIENKRAK